MAFDIALDLPVSMANCASWKRKLCLAVCVSECALILGSCPLRYSNVLIEVHVNQLSKSIFNSICLCTKHHSFSRNITIEWWLSTVLCVLLSISERVQQGCPNFFSVRATLSKITQEEGHSLRWLACILVWTPLWYRVAFGCSRHLYELWNTRLFYIFKCPSNSHVFIS